MEQHVPLPRHQGTDPSAELITEILKLNMPEINAAINVIVYTGLEHYIRIRYPAH